MKMNMVNTCNLNKDILDTFMGNNIIENNNCYIYGISGNLLFLVDGIYTAVYDMNNYKYLFPFKKGIFKTFYDKEKKQKVIVFGTSEKDDMTRIWYIKQDSIYQGKKISDYIGFQCFMRNSLLDANCYGKNDNFGLLFLNCFIYDVKGNKYPGKILNIKSEDFDFPSKFGENITYDEEFLSVYPAKVLDTINMIRYYNENKAELKQCDKWDAQSEYVDGLSVIYKKENDRELYGVVDDKYNIVFDYDPSIKEIKILNGRDLLLLKNQEDLSSIYDIKNNRYLTPFIREDIDAINKLSNDAYRIKFGDKYRFVYNGKIEDELYDQISIADDIFIFTLNGEAIFKDREENIIYKIPIEEYYKSDKDIYHYEDSKIIKHNIYTSEDSVLGRVNFYDENGMINDISSSEILKKYNQYFYDERGNVYLFNNKKYGVQLENDGICAYKWYDNKKEVYSFQKKLLENLISLADNEITTKKVLIKK